MFWLASGLLTHGRSRDLFSTHLTITSPFSTGCVSVAGITGVANLPTKAVVSCLALTSKLIIRIYLCSCPSKADHRACNKQHPHSDALCIPRSYSHDNGPITFWLAKNITWLTAGKYHSKPFFPTKPLSVSLPVGARKLQALTHRNKKSIEVANEELKKASLSSCQR